jgi:DNA polymerase-3 subunit delta
VRGAGNDLAPAFQHLLDHPLGDSLVVVEAGELAPASALRKLFETAGNAAAIPCYRDEGAGLEEVIRATLAGHGLTATPGALAFLAARLGGDRMLTRGEIDKLALYVGDAHEVTDDDAMACVGDTAAITLDDLADAVAGGDHAAAARALARLRLDGVAPVAILRALQRHFQHLHLALATIAAGAGAEHAVAGLRPPVFFKRRPAFLAQLRRWPAATAAGALDLLLEAEIDCKTTGLPAHAVCGHAVIRLTRAGARDDRASA